ncbi:unnamed protein product, partial [Brenthis ino]
MLERLESTSKSLGSRSVSVSSLADSDSNMSFDSATAYTRREDRKRPLETGDLSLSDRSSATSIRLFQRSRALV